MLVQKLNISDLQSENGTFDGTMVYAQNKVQSVVFGTKPSTCLVGSLYRLLCKKPVVHCCFPIASNPYRALTFRSMMAFMSAYHFVWRAWLDFHLV